MLGRVGVAICQTDDKDCFAHAPKPQTSKANRIFWHKEINYGFGLRVFNEPGTWKDIRDDLDSVSPPDRLNGVRWLDRLLKGGLAPATGSFKKNKDEDPALHGSLILLHSSPYE
jgi:hypothetical protein